MSRRTIDIDSEVFEELGSRARPFVDTEPNSVLRRLLELDEPAASTALSSNQGGGDNGSAATSGSGHGSRTSRSAVRKRAPKGSLLDEREYEIPLLQALEEQGGRGPTREILARVGELVNEKLTPLDRENLGSTGGARWQTRVMFVRLRMKEQKLLKPDSPRGMWEITDEGLSRLNKARVAAREGV